MEAKPYPETKRRMLIERSVADFVAFLEEITEEKQLIREKLLPSQVPGFRKGRAPLKLTVPRLIAKLKTEQELTNCDSPIWDSFKNAWKCWVGSRPELNNILLDFDNTVDFDENNKCIAPPNSELDLQCFNTLLEVNRNNKVDQETIRRFYEFGYFKEDERIEAVINQAMPRYEIERRQRLAALPAKIDKLSQTIASLKSRVSAVESANESEQRFNQHIAETRESFVAQFQELDQRITKVQESFQKLLSKTESNSTQMVSRLRQSIKSLDSRLSKEVEELEKSAKSLLETKPPTTEFVNSIERQIERLNPEIKGAIQSFEARFEKTNLAIAEIKSQLSEHVQTTSAPQIAYQAVQIGERYAVKLGEEKERYNDESDYLRDFGYCLRRFGITNSDETAAAIHVALKAFPALEVADTRIIEVWRLTCGNHLHISEIDVEMGWLGLQDWFPNLFADECFGERLERIDLDISIRKMLAIGNMPWVIHLSNCDRSFPESYLPRFLNWICDFSEGAIRVFLTRCSGTNRCETSEEVYNRVARLPKPQDREPIEARKVKPKVFVTLSEWESWCRPNSDANSLPERQREFLNQLRSAIDAKMDVQIPREICHYLRLSHGIMAETRALDWALTLRLLPWIGNRRKLINITQELIHREGLELPHFQNGLQKAGEEG